LRILIKGTGQQQQAAFQSTHSMGNGDERAVGRGSHSWAPCANASKDICICTAFVDNVLHPGGQTELDYLWHIHREK